MSAQQLTILVTGACGQMGKYVVAGVVEAPDMELVGAVDPAGRGKRLSEIVSGAPEDIICSGHLAATLEESQPQIMIDFTTPDVVMDNIQAALNAGVACVVGTTGFSPLDLQVVKRLCKKTDTPCLIAPNFSIGANLMMRFAAEASTNFDYSEIIERHHELTAHEELAGARGGETAGIHVHSVRMPGYVANQEVVFGGSGEVLKIEHITTSRECFVPGVLLATRRILELEGLVYGLDTIL